MRRHISSILFILCLSLLVIGCFQDKGIITGRITDKNNNPVVGALITTEPGGYNTLTNNDGTFILENIPLGEYTVTANAGVTASKTAVLGNNIGCTSIDLSMGSQVSAEVDIQFDDDVNVLNTFPLEVGNQWTYYATLSFDTTVTTGTISRSITGTMEISSTTCYGVQDIYEYSNNATVTNYWAIVNNELLNFANDSPGPGEPPLMPTSVNINSILTKFSIDFEQIMHSAWSGSIPGQFKTQEFTYYDTPPKILVYPLTQGKTWIFASPAPYLTITREVVGFETVTVPAGIFYCVKIQHKIEGIDDLYIYMWYSDIGLVKSSIYTETIEESPLSSFIVNEVFELISYSIN